MAKIVLTDAFILIDGVDMSDHGSHVEIDSKKDLVDVTSFGAASKTNLLGLGDGTMTFKLFQDFAAGSVDATLQPIHAAGTAVAIEVRPTSAARSATNPAYTMTGVLPEYTPLSGDVGTASEIQAVFQNAADVGIQRLTS